MRTKCWTWLVTILFLAKLAVGQGYEIYVFNHPVSTKVIFRNNKAYVLVRPLVAALGLTVQDVNGSLWIGKPPTQKIEGHIILNGQSFKDALQVRNGQDELFFVAIKPFVEATGNKIIVNKDTGIIDVIPATSSISQKEVESLRLTNSKDAPKNAVEDNFSTYQNSKTGISIKYPSSWRKMDDLLGTGLTAFIYTSREGSNVTYVYVAVITRELREAEKSMTEEQILKSDYAMYRSHHPDMSIISESTTTLGNKPARKMVYTIPSDPEIMRKQMNVGAIVNGKLCGIGFMTSEENFNKYLPTVEKMMDSLEVK